MNQDDIRNVLGDPDFVGTGTIWEDGAEVACDCVWTYCSYFNWTGSQNRWDRRSRLDYWVSRMNPKRHYFDDELIAIWFANGKAVKVSKATNRKIPSPFESPQVFE